MITKSYITSLKHYWPLLMQRHWISEH